MHILPKAAGVCGTSGIRWLLNLRLFTEITGCSMHCWCQVLGGSLRQNPIFNAVHLKFQNHFLAPLRVQDCSFGQG